MFGFYLNMRISCQKDNTSFKSMPIHGVHVIDVQNKELIPAVFSKLDPQNFEDQEAIKEIASSWLKLDKFNLPKQIKKISTDNTRIFYKFFKDLLDEDRNFYTLELPQKSGKSKPLAKRIIGIMGIRESERNNRLCLSLLNTKPKFIFQHNQRQIKGVGENLFAEAINLAYEKGYFSVIIDSHNDPFYFGTLKNAQLEDQELRQDGLFVIPQKYFKKYLDYWKTKFDVNPSQSI